MFQKRLKLHLKSCSVHYKTRFWIDDHSSLILMIIQHTIVRWSAAKGIARISDRLPSDFVEQVLDTIMGLFSIHSIAVATIYEMPSIAENTWHGACLACAEMARRGLVADSQLSVLIDWLLKVCLSGHISSMCYSPLDSGDQV
jgi:hypothetical protein